MPTTPKNAETNLKKMQEVRPAILKNRVYTLLPPLDLPPNLQITSVNPTTPVEHTPITIAFSLTNQHPKQPLNGQVISATGTAAQIVNLPPGETFNGTVAAVAPASGASVMLSIDFYEALPNVEFPPPTASGSINVGVSATYVMTFDSLWIDYRCSKLEGDIVDGSVAATLGDMPLDNPTDPTDHSGARHVSLGGVPVLNTIPLDVAFAPFTSLPGTTPPLVVAYAFVSQGGQEVVKAIMNVLSGGAAGVLDVIYPQAAAVWKEIDSLVQQLHSLIFDSCGRGVASNKFSVPSEQLLALTSATGVYTQPQIFKVDPPRGWPCQSSSYTVTFTIHRTSFKP